MDVRLAQPQDHQKLVDLLCVVHGEEFRALADLEVSLMFSSALKKLFFIVAVENEEVVGVAAISEEMFTTDVWGITWVGVHPNHRHNGVGQEVVEGCLNQILGRVEKPVTVILRTHPDQTGLYDRVGFKVLGPDHEGGTFMTKTIG
ncbi:MAG TPA: GNAT family N-acetyltransferase [Alphaproteobacteria bacterium]|nr:GNAT family N-acetyltransferase [Alphaproteobacteria bacterium]HOO50142.1 GNAT family N-acetyltransferase [Alphaproteobacteria bacterium]